MSCHHSVLFAEVLDVLFVLGCVQFCMILILMFGFYESQRFNFEYSFYTRITEFTAYILGWDNLKYNYRERIYDSGNEKIPNLNKEVEQGNAFTIYYNENSPKIATELKYKNENEKSTLLGAFIANKIKENIEKFGIVFPYSKVNNPQEQADFLQKIFHSKLAHLYSGTPAPLVTDSPWFYIALTTMILGTQLFVAGFLGELVSRNAPGRNDYQIEKEI